MRSISVIHCSTYLLAASAAASSNTTAIAAENYVVIAISRNSEELSLGTRFIANDRIVVPANVTVTLLGEDGSIERLVGPSAYIITKEELPSGQSGASRAEYQSKLAAIGDFLSGEGRRIESVGGTRSGNQSPGPSYNPDPWVIPIETTDHGCVRDGRIVLWRRDAKESLSLAVRFGDELHDKLVWDENHETFDASGYVPDNVDSVRIELDHDTLRTISLTQLPAGAEEGPLDVASWMARSGCNEQAFAFIRQLAGR
ncbi:MAG: hypothetical protein M9924_03595 [Rhizobiaceae bacterium]|nr:hypothetical protein [Rhizobiaceae bacterium]